MNEDLYWIGGDGDHYGAEALKVTQEPSMSEELAPVIPCICPSLLMRRFHLTHTRAYWCENCEKTVVISDFVWAIDYDLANIFGDFGENWKQLVEGAKEL
jgi:hypothetical protein